MFQELEAKRRAEGKVTEKLSKKQIEAKQAQLKVESEIRNKVQKVDAFYTACVIAAMCEIILGFLYHVMTLSIDYFGQTLAMVYIYTVASL